MLSELLPSRKLEQQLTKARKRPAAGKHSLDAETGHCYIFSISFRLNFFVSFR
jgi:hypothetical protein